jgi:hopene-associated glycosyltransferase HpnB
MCPAMQFACRGAFAKTASSASYTVGVNAFLTIVGGTASAAWIYLVVFHARFWSVRANLAEPTAKWCVRRVVAVVPARNEADVIARSVSSLLAQPTLTHVVLVDDHSSDGTAERARETAKAIAADSRLSIVSGRELPPGWSGKLWAMRQGIDVALTFAPDYLLLTDADIAHEPASTRTLVAIAEDRNRDMVSLMAKLHCNTWIEKLLIPAFVFFFFKLYPPRWVADRHRAVAGAAGGCILIRPQALARAGGLDAIRGAIIDDCALAGTVKGSGGTIELALTNLVHSIRPYTARDIERMISRTAFSQLRHSALLLTGALAGLVLVYVAPVLLLAARARISAVLGLSAWALMAAAYRPMVRFYRLSALWALSLPVAALFYMGATVHSAVRFWRGSGGAWKGRIQDPITVKQL